MLKAPYPYFGGKSKVASTIWARFGNVKNYIEPFFGSGAVLLARATKPDLELVNDIDGYIVNFWRAVQADAEAVAAHADWPAFENDLHARHAWLVSRKDSLQARLEGDPDWYDAKIAGWWVWGMSLWIGSGFCSGRGAWASVDGKLVNTGANGAVARQLPQVVDRSLRADFVNDYTAIVGQLPQYGPRGRRGVDRSEYDTGVARQLPYLSRPRNGVWNEPGLTGVTRQTPRLTALIAYFDALQERFSRVRVVCGDWTRVMSPAVLTAKTPTGILLDPPYTDDGRDADLYNTDDATIHVAVRQWAIDNGDNPAYRIAYCGYDDGFAFPGGWTKLHWKANGGYANQGDGRTGNAKRETVWFSPHCLHGQMDLFSYAAAEAAP